MTLARTGAPVSVLLTLRRGPVERKKLQEAARVMAGGENAANNAIWRLQKAGCIECVYRLTQEGEKRLKESMA